MGRVTAGIGVRGGADDDRLVELHDGSLDGVGERASGGGTHVHHHATLTRGDLMVTREGRMDGGKEGRMEGRKEGGSMRWWEIKRIDRTLACQLYILQGIFRLDPSITDGCGCRRLKKNRIKH